VYFGLAWHFWNTRWRPVGGADTAAIRLQSWERALVLVPLVLHAWLLYRSFFASPELRFGFAQALSAILWLGVALYWIESLFTPLDGMEPLVMPVAGVAVLLQAIFPGRVSPQPLGNVEFTLHVLLFILAYGVLTIAIVHAALMSFLERDLHHPAAAARGGALRRFLTLPPLLSMERVLFRLIAVSFVLLSAALAIGVALSESTFGRPFRFDHKTVFSILAWITLGVLLVGRHAYGWRGRTALRWSIAGFIFLMLAYVGRSFVLEVILQRS
jgi:ABC-type uncharacterized transport system permease subunit